MQATTGTNAAIWTNYLLAAITALVQLIQPAMLAAVLPPWLTPFVAPILLVVNGIVHAKTGNSATSVLPGVVAPSAPSVSQQG